MLCLNAVWTSPTAGQRQRCVTNPLIRPNLILGNQYHNLTMFIKQLCLLLKKLNTKLNNMMLSNIFKISAVTWQIFCSINKKRCSYK